MRTLLAFASGAACAVSALAGYLTSEPTYLLAPASGDFTFKPLLTVGEYVPVTGGAPSDKYAFVGIPDAMGLHKDPVTGENILFVAHELGGTATTAPIYGAATQLKGAWVSRFVLDTDASIVSGNLAHGELYLGNTFYSATPPNATSAAAFTRFCSGSFAGPAHGMDRPIFLTNEESATGTFHAGGSQVVAIFDGDMHTLPDLGRTARETTLVMPRRDAITAILSTEDGGTLDSYIYLYVGTKQRRSTDVLAKNGLSGGKTYVLAAASGAAGEDTFTSGSIATKWVEIPNAASLTDPLLDAASAAANGFKFVRVEDAEFDPLAPTRSCFVATTGGSSPNRLGRLYKLNFSPTNPIANGTLDMIYNADAIVTPGGGAVGTGTDFAVSIDNIAVTANYIVICEDRNSPADAVFAYYGRNGGVWTLDRNNGYAAKYQGDFNYAYTNTRDGVTRTAGLWEASGVIDASSIYGPDSFIINVQAHGTDRTNVANPAGGTYTQAQADDLFAEDGQLLLMTLKK